jgi:hypothetical protein
MYAPCTDNDQLQFLQWMHGIHIPSYENYMMAGDFNLIRSPQDCNRLGGNINEMLLFNETISHLGLVDIPLKGKKSTLGVTCRTLPCFIDWIGSSLPWHGLTIFQTLWMNHLP